VLFVSVPVVKLPSDDEPVLNGGVDVVIGELPVPVLVPVPGLPLPGFPVPEFPVSEFPVPDFPVPEFPVPELPLPVLELATNFPLTQVYCDSR